MGSASFSSAREGLEVGALPMRRSCTLGLLLGLCALLLGGCVTVQPQDKEFLADPTMTFGSEGTLGAQSEHVRNNREGSFGGSSSAGGGCGCN